jgi:enoyl-CoA hydratase/carnithine racemase
MSDAAVSSPVRFDQEGDVGLITLAAPPLNLFDQAMLDGLDAAIGEAEQTELRALIVRAEGRAFSGGVDVKMFQGMRAADLEEWDLVSIPQRLEALPYPTLGVVHALCLTAGFELVLGCDLLWASQSAKFGLVEKVVGVTPFMGGTQRVAERAGPARAREFVMTGRPYPAATLEQWGVVNRVLPDDELEPKARAFAQELAAGPTLAHAATKQVVRAVLDGGVVAADATLVETVGVVVESEDFAAGVATFIEQGGPGHAAFSGH